MDDSYVYLISEKNNAAEWTTFFAPPLNYNCGWTVGLHELIYPKTMYNILGDTFVHFVDSEQNVVWTKPIPIGFYQNVEQLNEKLNKIFKQLDIITPNVNGQWILSQPPCITEDQVTGKIMIQPAHARYFDNMFAKDGYQPKRVYPIFTGDLEKTLGLHHPSPSMATIISEKNGRTKLTSTPFSKEIGEGDPLLGFTPINLFPEAIFVHCDAVAPRWVGKSHEQVLDIVHLPREAKVGHMVSIKGKENIIYTPTVCQNIEEMKIQLKDINGKTLRFAWGRTVVVLHFKKIEF